MNEYTPLEQTTLTIYLEITTEPGADKHFVCNEISKALKTEPYQSFNMGESGGILGLKTNFSLWRGLKYESNEKTGETPDVSPLIAQLTDALDGKTDYLLYLKKEYKATVKLVVSPIIVSGVAPALNINRAQLEFLSKAGIELDFDMFICPFEYKKKQ